MQMLHLHGLTAARKETKQVEPSCLPLPKQFADSDTEEACFMLIDGDILKCYAGLARQASSHTAENANAKP